MNYIDLTLKKINSKHQDDEYIFADVVNQENIVIILGSTGSGKTSILKKFLNENTDTVKFLTVKTF